MPQSPIVDIKCHPIGRQPRVWLDANSHGLAVQEILTLEALDHLNLRLCQLFLALVSEFAQRRHGLANIGITNEEVEIVKHPKTEIAIRFKRENGALERNCLNAALLQGFHHRCEPIEQPAISLTCLIDVHTKSIENVVRNALRCDGCQRMPDEPGQPMVNRLSRK